MDIKSDFRLLTVYPGDFDLLGYRVDNNIYRDKMLSLGSWISAKLFELFSSFLDWYVQFRSGQSPLDHYLDDFIWRCK